MTARRAHGSFLASHVASVNARRHKDKCRAMPGAAFHLCRMRGVRVGVFEYIDYAMPGEVL